MSSTVGLHNTSANLGTEILGGGEFELSEQHAYTMPPSEFHLIYIYNIIIYKYINFERGVNLIKL
jgi:hypothetical protein